MINLSPNSGLFDLKLTINLEFYNITQTKSMKLNMSNLNLDLPRLWLKLFD